MSTFEITIERETDDGWPVVVERTNPGSILRSRTEGMLKLDSEGIRELQASERKPKVYGAILGQALFRDGMRDAFARARADTAADDRLRVLLTVEDETLRTWRWERLCAPFAGTWNLLALSHEVPFSRYLPSLTDRRFPPLGRRDLRALIVAASPSDLARFRLEPFDVAAAVAGVRSALGDIPSHVLATSDGGAPIDGVVGPATLDALAEHITGGAYTLLHLIGHGTVARDQDATSETTVLLAKADGTVDPVTGTRLLDRLALLSPRQGFPRLSFLASCESASPTAEAAGALGGLAQRLVRELGMPAVVAMTDPVTVATTNALAGRFYQRLREHGEPDLALVEATAGLAERGDITVSALYSRLTGQSLFTDTRPLPELTNAEIGDGLTHAAPLLAERAPILLEDADPSDGQQRGFTHLAESLRGLLGAEPAALSEGKRQERLTLLHEVDAICTEALDLGFAALALGDAPPAYDTRRPFRGLHPFRAEDRAFFFGREELIEELRQRLEAHPFLPVLGPSGSGKSSVVLAGLVPKLVGATPGPDGANPIPERDMRPGDDPVARLEELLARLADSPGVLVVDQFEEVFTLCQDESRRVAFFDRLLALTAERPVVLTMRADFWGECAPYPTLRAAMEARQRLIAPLDANALRAVIEQQAGTVGLRFEADLAATIVEHVQDEPGAMPLLQHALTELWQRRHGRWLVAREYRAIGGVQGAIAKTAEGVYAKLTEPERERTRDIFMRLTRLDKETTPGVERRDTRRRVALEDLVPAGSDLRATKALVARLATAGLLVTSRRTSGAEPDESTA